MAMRCRARQFRSDDLPTFGRPTMTTDGIEPPRAMGPRLSGRAISRRGKGSSGISQKCE
jgi:hypothetical protein